MFGFPPKELAVDASTSLKTAGFKNGENVTVKKSGEKADVKQGKLDGPVIFSIPRDTGVFRGSSLLACRCCSCTGVEVQFARCPLTTRACSTALRTRYALLLRFVQCLRTHLHLLGRYVFNKLASGDGAMKEMRNVIAKEINDNPSKWTTTILGACVSLEAVNQLLLLGIEIRCAKQALCGNGGESGALGLGD